MFSHSSICRQARLSSPLARYGAEAGECILRYGAPVGYQIEHYHRLPRCMDLLRDRIAKSTPTSSIATGTVIRADALSHSNGRFDRIWHAPSGGLYLALAWADTLLPVFSRLFPFAIGLACCETINAFGVESRIKWVNDIHVSGAKVGGVLCETVSGPGNERFHITGIGLNVNTMAFPQELQDTATSLHLLTGRVFDLDQVFTMLLARLQWNIGLLCFVEEQELAGLESDGVQMNLLLRRWQELSDTRGRTVQYGFDVQKKPMYKANAIGIDHQGGLEMKLADGSRLTEYSGEIMYCADGE